MYVSKRSLDVFEGEKHTVRVGNEIEEDVYAWVGFYENENLIRHSVTFESRSEAWNFYIKIFSSSNANGIVKLNPKYWYVFEKTIEVKE